MGCAMFFLDVPWSKVLQVGLYTFIIYKLYKLYTIHIFILYPFVDIPYWMVSNPRSQGSTPMVQACHGMDDEEPQIPCFDPYVLKKKMLEVTYML